MNQKIADLFAQHNYTPEALRAEAAEHELEQAWLRERGADDCAEILQNIIDVQQEMADRLADA